MTLSVCGDERFSVARQPETEASSPTMDTWYELPSVIEHPQNGGYQPEGTILTIDSCLDEYGSQRVMKPRIFWKLIGLVMLVCLGMPALAEASQQRLALIVGNGAYENIGALRNPTADARLISETLNELGFETTMALDSDQADMKRQIAEFGRRLRAADKDAVGFFYYAGHGVQAGGRNYLLPVEARPTDVADLDLMGVEANWVLRQMESAGNRTNIIVLDACRNNPFVASNRSLGRGLAQIDAPTGSFISYATAPGKVALDGESINSPFTTALARAMKSPGLPVEQIFKRVRVDVIKATQGGQIPWDSSSLVDDFIMHPEPAETSALAASSEQAQPIDEAELALWQRVSTTEDPDRIAMFLQIYPDSALAEQARVMLMKSLMGDSESAPAATSEDSTTTAAAPVDSQPAGNTASGTAVADAQTSAPGSTSGSESLTLAMTETNSVDSSATRNTDENTIAMLEDADRQLMELDMINTAQASADPADYLAYLDAFPDGTFADLARAEADNLLANTATDGPADGSLLKQENAPAVAEPSAPTASSSGSEAPYIDTPLPESQQITGRLQSIGELSQGSPLFPPFEGLAEDYWKNETCSNCHSWDKPSLCTQGKFYVGTSEDAITRIQHPYGGFFKSALKLWAEARCD